ncbi:MAG: Demethylrebeccamycin-D-glucose O-methyltransferase [Planctomycetota bacterium]|jgi:tocopherol O-methyltransferase
MISCTTIQKDVIRRHYDISTFFYWLLWGRHIHHGLWSGNESPQVAAQQLTERLVEEAGILRGSRVLDIGCGMGGSSIHLAKTLECRVTGVTLSPFQRRWASMAARLGGAGGRAEFLCADAEKVEFPAASADVVWSVECTEHLFDKPAFFRRAAEWLKPGGRMAICVWLAGDEPLTSAQEQLAFGVCEGFFCPSLGTEADYCSWMKAAGLEMTAIQDWTSRVSRTWEICRDRVNRLGMRRIARWIDPGQIIFLDRFQMLLDAYNTRAMKYGCLIAEKRR